MKSPFAREVITAHCCNRGACPWNQRRDPACRSPERDHASDGGPEETHDRSARWHLVPILTGGGNPICSASLGRANAVLVRRTCVSIRTRWSFRCARLLLEDAIHCSQAAKGDAESWAILASLLNTAKLTDLDPQTYRPICATSSNASSRVAPRSPALCLLRPPHEHAAAFEALSDKAPADDGCGHAAGKA